MGTTLQLTFVWPEPQPKRHRVYPAPTDETRVCEVCAQAYPRHPREWPHSFRRRRTCGRPCGNILRARERTYLLERVCAQCGKRFRPRGFGDKYCTRPCYWASKKGKPATYKPPQVQRVLVICPWCLRMHMRRPIEAEQGRLFCTRTCYRLFQAQFHLGKHIPYTELNAFYLSKAWSKLRRAAKRRDRWICQGCQRVFDHKSRGLVAHHIRPRGLFPDAGVSLHPVADRLENLVSLCKRCHQRTHLGQLPQFLDAA